MNFVINCFIAIIPALMVSFYYYGENIKTVNKWQTIFFFIAWAIGSNGILFLGLFLVDIHLLELLDIGMGFKIKYLILEFLLAGGIISIRNLWRKDKRIKSIYNILAILPETVFLLVTFAVFAPSSLFLSNIDEFFISYGKLLPILLVVSLLILVVCLMIAVVLEKEDWVVRWKAGIFGVALGFYLQSNFLNPDLPELNGIAIDWEQYFTWGILSSIAWLLCIVIPQVLISYCREILVKITKYTSSFLTAVQMITLVVLLLTTSDTCSSNIALLKEEEFTVGKENNIIIFVLDALGAGKMEEVLANNPGIKDDLEDFTFFTNAVSGGAYTSVGMPMFFTGMEFDSAYQDYDDYLQEAWSSVEIYDQLKEQNYDIRIFTDGRYLTNVSEEVISNAEYVGESYFIENYVEFAKDIYQFTGFYSMPQIIKPYFWLYSDDITRQIKTTGWEVREDEINLAIENEANKYTFDDVQFYRDYQSSNGLNVNYDNAYRLYHLFGAHPPFNMDENLQPVESDEIQQIKGSMKIVRDYIDDLKQLNLYDSSTIIITADHGRGSDEEGIQQNPCVMIKMAGEKHDLIYNDAPIHFRNVLATIAKSFMEDYSSYGPSVYDIDEYSDVERLHTIAAPVRGKLFPEIEDQVAFSRFIIPENARDIEGIKIYEPSKLNAFEYNIGDMIAFADSNLYAQQIDYRIYKENNTGIASTELSLYIMMPDYQGGDLEYKFSYSHVYNDTQNMRIYAAGEKVADINCTTEGSGTNISVFIKEQYIKNNVLPLRIVFPNAVTPKMVGESDTDTRVLSVAFDNMQIVHAN